MSKPSSKTSLNLSPRLSRRTMSTTAANFTPTFAPTFTPTHPTSFSSRRGNVRFSSGRFNPPKTTSRSRKGGGSFLSFRSSSSRRSAARPARARGVFESLLGALTDGIEAVRMSVDEMKSKLPSESSGTLGSMVNYYMDLEKQIKVLERKTRTLEVHKDRIEEMRDEYTLKLKLRNGAFNIAQALATQSSKAAKEKLQEARMEQRELLEDLCDIEDELETKLGVFQVHINGLVGLGRPGSGDVFETQLKLSSQKWKARCKISRQQQLWQDEDIVFLGKVTDELFVRVVEVKRIQGNVHIGSMKCLTRELFSFFPLNVTFNFPSSSVKLNMDVRWTPTLGDDFLSDLGLHTIHCLVGGQKSKLASRPSSCGNVERLHLYPTDPLITGLNADTVVHQIRIINEPEDTEPHRNSYERTEVKTKNVSHKIAKKRKGEEPDFVFLDRQSIVSNLDSMKGFPEAKQMQERQESGSIESGQNSHGSLGSNQSSGSGCSQRRGYTRSPDDTISLNTMVEAVTFAMEEPKEQYPELRALECQLSRLETALKGGKLTKSPSMTLSESQAMDSFNFLGTEDAVLFPRFSRASYSDFPENFHFGHPVSSRQPPRSSTPNRTFSSHTSADSDFHQVSIDSQQDEVFNGGYHEGRDVGHEGSNGTGSSGTSFCSKGKGSVGMESVDQALVQHLIHCESLLQHLQSAGALNYKLMTGLRKLQREAEIIAELLNIAAEQSVPHIEHILPELAANHQLMKFWKSMAKNDSLSVSYEQFAVGLDERFGQGLWNDFPEVANKVFTELLGRILDLDVEDWGTADNQMVITVFQYAVYFLPQGSNGILKCMREVAQELKITDGLLSGDLEVKHRIASHLSEYDYNCGALLAAAHLLADPDARLHRAAVLYLEKFAGSSPWHLKAVQYYVELLEHTDQAVRIGACSALSCLGADVAVPQLKYLARGDFSPVRAAACKALVALGEPDPSTESNVRYGSPKKPSTSSRLTPQSRKHTPLQRTRSAETTLSPSNDTTTTVL